MTPEAIEAYVDAAAAVVGLRLDPAHRPGVIRYFALAAGFADTVMAVRLDTADEPAESFVPIGPADGAELDPRDRASSGEIARGDR